MLLVMRDRNEAADAVGDLAAVKGELAAVKRDLAEANVALAEHGNSLAGNTEDLAAVKGELAALRGEVAEKTSRLLELEAALEEALIALVRGDWGSTRALELVPSLAADSLQAVSSAFGGETKRLMILDLTGLSNLSDTALRAVSTMTHLKKLWLNRSSGFSAEGVKHLYKLPKLEALDLRKTSVSDGALEGIGGMSSLEWLVLDSANVTDAGLLHLTGLSSLKLLSIFDCKGVTSAAMQHVGRLTSLDRLWVDGTEVKDDGLLHLTSLTKLKILSLGEGITDAGMEHIGQLTSLEGFQLWGSKVCHEIALLMVVWCTPAIVMWRGIAKDVRVILLGEFSVRSTPQQKMSQ
ncbi:unnamed protein product, partial [Closterium sp. Yama58-4]